MNNRTEIRTPTVVDVMRLLPASRHTTRDGLAWILIVANLCAWILVFTFMLAASSLFIKAALATVLGAITGTFFVIGHDACHGSLFSSARRNRFAALLAFLPSLHSPTSWEWGHNRMHHSWTNLRGKDDGFPPLSLTEYQALSPLQRGLRRSFHTLFGIGFFYMIEVWWKRLFWLPKLEFSQLRTARNFQIERISIVFFVCAQIALVLILGAWKSIMEVALCVVWPFIVWNWVMAFVTVQHHTHPRVRWFEDEKKWSYFQSQVGGTVHLKLPRPIEWAFANIFEHTAHHADKRIPLYKLPESQRAIEREFPDTVIVQRFSIGHLRAVVAQCRLYDYENARWLDFDGSPTTPSLLEERAVEVPREAGMSPR